MRQPIRLVLFFVCLSPVLLLWMLSAQNPAPQDYKVPPAPEQPIPFSHKTHTTAGIKCTDCHTLRDENVAGIPKETTCLGCHMTIKKDSPAIQKLTEFAKSKQSVPWVRVYRVPDYVYFSHQAHHKDAGFSCDTCHGPVAERDVIAKEKPITMQACMSCHAKHQASNGCDFCHAGLQ